MDLLDYRNCAWFAQQIHELLEPGGEVLFYESNPWNVVLKLRRAISGRLGRSDRRQLLDRLACYELVSEVGFFRVFAVFNDFAYAPLTASAIWFLRNLSILLENLPGIRTLAGSILIHAQKPLQHLLPEFQDLFDRAAEGVDVVVGSRFSRRSVLRWKAPAASSGSVTRA